MKKFLSLLFFLVIPGEASAQTAADLVGMWLSQHSIAATDYKTCDPSPHAVIGTDGICVWGSDLGMQPTVAQLQALIPTYQAQRVVMGNAIAAQTQYAAAIAAGLTVTSAATPAMNDIYSVSDVAQANITSIQASIASGLGFPNGAATLTYFGSGGSHSITAANWTNLAKALRDYKYNLQVALFTAQSGGTPTWPAASVTIP